MTCASVHTPVMLREVLDALMPRDGGLYVDGTFGRGGYTRALLEAAQTRVIGIDRDPEAIAAGEAMAKAFAPRLKLIQGAFGSMVALLGRESEIKVDGIALDLGVSSPQIDTPSRGFSFREDGPLDMRMSGQGRSAADIVNGEKEEVLADIVFRLGQERFSRRIARAIVAARAQTPFLRTSQLADLVRGCVPRSRDGIDPATRTFQALRIAVNDELGELQRGLEAAEILLAPGGRLAVVSFHSLEDGCVKNFLRDRCGSAPRVSRHTPVQEGTVPAATFSLVTRKPVPPTEDEAADNPRARSARLRVAERTDAAAMKESAL